MAFIWIRRRDGWSIGASRQSLVGSAQLQVVHWCMCCAGLTSRRGVWAPRKNARGLRAIWIGLCFSGHGWCIFTAPLTFAKATGAATTGILQISPRLPVQCFRPSGQMKYGAGLGRPSVAPRPLGRSSELPGGFALLVFDSLWCLVSNLPAELTGKTGLVR